VGLVVILVAGFAGGCAQEAPKRAETGRVAPEQPGNHPSGEALFKQYCSSCHPDGGNVSDPGRPLYGSALKRNHITAPEDIVRIMRNPLSRMIRFDVSTLSDRDARAIAEYILTAFK
jgi:cytochrome c6